MPRCKNNLFHVLTIDVKSVYAVHVFTLLTSIGYEAAIVMRIEWSLTLCSAV